MEYDPEQCDDRRLLELLNQAFQDWKRMEKLYKGQDKVYVRQNDKGYNGETLKSTYLSLLREARKRDIFLTSEELFNTIIYTKVPKKRGYLKIESYDSKKR
ncbi:MAG TPA: hypothetical protein VFD57_04515 [Clostridia bacterium]|nr:hypothetical protein [Clostridia bacterium]